MYIAPNTNIKILKNCPLDESFNHTIYFNNAEEQRDYFSSLCPSGRYNLTKQSYQRVRKGAMRVEIKAEDLYDCNYLMFQNESFGNKWFYAFITSVEYVNNITSEITFMIDPMQTWFFDYTLKESFVEREHSATDVIGENLLPENLELGDYVADNFTRVTDKDGGHPLVEYYIDIVATWEYIGDRTVGGNVLESDFVDKFSSNYCNLPGCCWHNLFPLTEGGIEKYGKVMEFVSGSKEWWEAHDTSYRIDGIICVVLVPKLFVMGNNQGLHNVDIEYSKNYRTLGGYTPRNKKLFTYPYNFLYVTNNQGTCVSMPYEYFSDDTCKFRLTGNIAPNPAIMLTPTNYKGVVDNFDEKIMLDGFPQISYTCDSYQAWLAQTCGTGVMNGIASALLGGSYTVGKTHEMGDMMRNIPDDRSPASTFLKGSVPVISGALGVASAVQEMRAHVEAPPQARGNVNGNILASMKWLDFGFMRKHIMPQFARVIDDYFDVYGYSTNRKKIPNRNVRPHWTYTKTIGCVITGNISSDDRSMICSIYDKGITFWKHGSEVGNYSLDNRV